MNHTTPDPFVSIAARGHRPRIGKEPRLHLSSTTVDDSTLNNIHLWMAMGKVKQGILIDRLVTFAALHNFPATLKK